jgi:phage anti-repressor protein
MPFYKILLEYTTIDRDFIKTFFKKFQVGHELDFYIKDIDVAKYLDIDLITLRKKLTNQLSKDILYVENVDYIKIKSDKYKTSKTYLLNYRGFERLAMNSDSKKSDEIRSYFIKIREFIFENQDIIYQSMTNYDELKKYRNLETIYFFAVDKNYNDIFKIGRTKDIINRLRVYNVGRINEIDLKYLV